MDTSSPLSLNDAVSLAAIISAAQRCADVTRLIPEDAEYGGGLLVSGTARSIGTDTGAFLTRGEDVREAHLRVTASSGMEHFWPLSALVPEHQAGTFALDYRAD